MQYTKLRGRIYWFSRRAPQPLIPEMSLRLGDVLARVGKNGYIRFSLDTADPRAAAKAARKYAHLLDEAIDRLMQVKNTPVKVPASLLRGTHTHEEIVRAAETMYMALLAGDEGKNKAAVDAAFGKTANWTETGLSGVGMLPEMPEPDRYEWTSDDLPESSPTGDADLIRYIAPLAINHLVRTTGKFPAGVDSSFLPFAHAFRRFVRAMEGRREGNDIPTPPLPPVPVKPCSWAEAFDYYFSRKKHLSQATRDNYRLAWASLERSAKCLPAELTVVHVTAWINEGLSGLHHNTRNSRLTWAKTVWDYNRVHSKIPRNTACPFEGLQASEGEVESSRQKFSVSELKALFSAPVFRTARAVSVHAGYWVPLLALYQGFRLEEITGLEVVDVADSSVSTLTIRVQPNETRPRLKNKWARRYVPVHPKLLELGFSDYVLSAREAGIKPLFPSLARSESFGEDYVAHVRTLLSVTDKDRLVGLHCLRHNWEQARRDAIPSIEVSAGEYLAGRKYEKGSSVEYGSEACIPKLLHELQKLSYDSYDLTFHPAPPVTVDDLLSQDEKRRRSMTAAKQRAASKAVKQAASLG